MYATHVIGLLTRAFRHHARLTRNEQGFYENNVKLDDDDELPPVRAWKKYIAFPVLIVLTLLPMFMLLLYGLKWGPPKTKSWFIASCLGIALDLLVVEPLAIVFYNVLMPSFIRTKLKLLVNPAAIARFPFQTPL